MKRSIASILSIVLLSIIIAGFVESTNDEVRVGSQVWMTKNLNVDRFQNGDFIQEVKTVEEWIAASKLRKPAWCYFKNDSTLGPSVGKLYNWHAVNDPRKLAPKGWRIPSVKDVENLVSNLGDPSETQAKIRSKSGWKDFWGENRNGTNESGLNILPSGIRFYRGRTDKDKGWLHGDTGTIFWTTDLITPGSKGCFGQETSCLNAYQFEVTDGLTRNLFISNASEVENFYSVRCIKN